jgi:cytochrome P450
MSHFVPLETSVFDAAFTLDPFTTLAPLYDDEKVLGFSSHGMNFCFRFSDCRELIGAHTHVAREPVAADDSAEAERSQRQFAQLYPTRAWHFAQLADRNKVKGLLNRYLQLLLPRISLEQTTPVFAPLREPGRHDDYLERIRLLPMRTLLDAWGFQVDDTLLPELYDAGIALVKSFDNYDNADLLAAGERGIARMRRFVTEQIHNAGDGTLLQGILNDARSSGIDDDQVIAFLITFINASTNTLSISTVLMLRNILRYPEPIDALRQHPESIDDHVVMELLRRDNHVKALARQVHVPFSLRGHALERGDALYIFYPGANMDPTHWHHPERLDFQRHFTRENHNLFGGSRYACIGSRIALQYFAGVLPGILQNLPRGAQLIEEEVTVDPDWITERVVTRLPILVPECSKPDS